MIPTRLFDIPYYQLNNYPQSVAVKSMVGGGSWKSFSSVDCIENCETLAFGLLQKGIQPGQKVGIISQLGSASWNFVDFALQMIGAVSVPLHATSSTKQLAFIIQDANLTIFFSSDDFLADKLNLVSEKLKRTSEIFVLGESKKYKPWQKLQLAPTEILKIKLSEAKTNVQPNDLATIIYTSGTTGDPKGVMLSHYNILCNINSTAVLLPIHAGLRTLSYLPMSHIFERMVILTYFFVGASIHYARSIETILEDLQSTKPHYFTTVPRLLERVHEGLITEANQGNKIKQAALKWALKLGSRYDPNRKFAVGFWLKRTFADLFIYRQWRNLIGGNVRGVVVGAAPLQPRLGRLFSAAGIRIREGYGLTETSPVVSFNRFEPGGHRFGTVGLPIPGVEIKIKDPNENGEGEIIVKGPNVMMGYYNRADITAQVIDKEGWFSTGDTGKFVHKHFLQITGRKKDIFKTTTGKYVAPYHVENTLKSSIFISQCMVLGSGKPYPGSLIIPNFVQLERWCKENEVHWTGPQFMVLNPKVQQLFGEIIKKLNTQLSKEEKVRRFYLLHEEWSVATGEYGPTLKLIRKFIREKYPKEIDALFSAKDNFVPK